MNQQARPLDKFGRFVMANLRDRCIEHFDFLADCRWKAPCLQGLQQELATLSSAQREVARRCVVAGIDSAIHDFLFRLQELADFENDIQIFVDGQNIVPLSDGIYGEPYGTDGWRARYSRYGEGQDEPR